MKKLFLALAVVVCAGCVQYGPTPYSTDYYRQQIDNERSIWTSEINNALSSQDKISPLPKNWQKIVKEAISAQLKDPYSAKYTFTDKPTYYGFSNKGQYKGKYRVSQSPLLGYVGSVLVNAKNSYGAYTGDQLWLFIITEDSVSYLVTNNIVKWQSTQEAVSHINGYEVFISK